MARGLTQGAIDVKEICDGTTMSLEVAVFNDGKKADGWHMGDRKHHHIIENIAKGGMLGQRRPIDKADTALMQNGILIKLGVVGNNMIMRRAKGL